MSRVLTFTTETGGERLDKFLADRCPELSRSRLQRLIADGLVTVDRLEAKSSSRLSAGQRVKVTTPDQVKWDLVPQDIPLNVVYQDQDILVIDKPAGLTVHPSPGHRDQTLVNAVLALCPELQRIGGTIRPGIVHRLDKDTSGLLVMAKNEMSHAQLTAQLKDPGFTKVYLALVDRHLPHEEAVIEAPVGRDPGNRKRMAVVTHGRKATTRYRVVRYYKEHTLVEARPVTGRTHQIRVHFASLRHPLAGDRIYGKRHPLLNRHFLHAKVLGFRLPSTERYVEFTSELPVELRAFLDALESPTEA